MLINAYRNRKIRPIATPFAMEQVKGMKTAGGRQLPFLRLTVTTENSTFVYRQKVFSGFFSGI